MISSVMIYSFDWVLLSLVPMQSAVAEWNRMSPAMKIFGKPILELLFSETHSEVYMCVPARELIWNFTTELVHKLHTNPLLKAAGANYPRDYVNMQLNNSINDSYPSTIYTGVENIDNIAQFIQWDGLRKLNSFDWVLLSLVPMQSAVA